MKKYVILYSISITIIVSMVIGSVYLKNSIINVNVIDVSTSSVQNTVLCSGVVEYSDSQDVMCKNTAVTNDVFVKEGDYVNKGDYLTNVTNVKVERKSIADINSTSIGELSNMNNLTNIQEVYNSLITESKNNPSDYTKYGDAYNIRAPISGLVTSVNTEKGKFINENASIITISNTNNMQVKLDVNESQIAEIKVGQKAFITGVGFKGSEYTGKVTNISNEAEKIVGPTGKETVINVIVKLDKVNGDIKPGYTAKCKIITSEENDVILTPYESIKADESGNEYVYQYKNGKAVKTYVETGNEYQNGYEIVSGLSNGDKIIEKPDKVYSNSRVKVSTNY